MSTTAIRVGGSGNSCIIFDTAVQNQRFKKSGTVLKLYKLFPSFLGKGLVYNFLKNGTGTF